MKQVENMEKVCNGYWNSFRFL